MPIPVSLAAVVDELETVSSDIYAYINKTTGELLTVSNDELVLAETGYEVAEVPDWQRESIAVAEAVLNSPDFVRLPTSLDIHQWSIMQEFCNTVQGHRQRANLLNQIHGKGAFRKFNEALDRYNLLDEWFAFHKAALTRIAAEFLEETGIPFVP